MTIQTIVHPTDFSECSSRALDVAVGLAAAHRAALHIIRVDVLHGDGPREAGAAFDRYVDSARRRLREDAPGSPPPIEAIRTRAVLPGPAIVQAAVDRDADLVVMGTHGRSGFRRLLLGSVAESVLRHAPCSVLTVGAEAEFPRHARLRIILIPVDFSESAQLAAGAVQALASDGHTTVQVLHVVEPIPPMYYAGDVSSRFELDGDLRARIEERLRAWSAELPSAQPIVTEGHPAVEIARVAGDCDADLIVMSTTGATGVDWLLVGSVTERVCRLATAPVLAVRARRRDRGRHHPGS